MHFSVAIFISDFSIDKKIIDVIIKFNKAR